MLGERDVKFDRKTMFGAFPLLALPVLAYNLIALTLAGGFGAIDAGDKIVVALFKIRAASGGMWAVSPADLLLSASLVVLFIELIKSTYTSSSQMVDHGLSMLVFIACLVEFLLQPKATTSVFFFIMTAALVDVVAGALIGIRAARRDLNIGSDS